MKCIAVSSTTKYWLDELMRKNETYSEVIDRLIEFYDTNRDRVGE